MYLQSIIECMRSLFLITDVQKNVIKMRFVVVDLLLNLNLREVLRIVIGHIELVAAIERGRPDPYIVKSFANCEANGGMSSDSH